MFGVHHARRFSSPILSLLFYLFTFYLSLSLLFLSIDLLRRKPSRKQSYRSGSAKLSRFISFRIHLDEPKARGGRLLGGGLVRLANANVALSSLQGGSDRRKQARLLMMRMMLMRWWCLLLLEFETDRSLVASLTLMMTTATTVKWKCLRQEGFRGPQHPELAGKEPGGHQDDPEKQKNRQQRDVCHRPAIAAASIASEPLLLLLLLL